MHIALKDRFDNIKPGCLIVTNLDTYTLMPHIGKEGRDDNVLQLISLQCHGVYEQRFRTTNDIVYFIQNELNEVITKIVCRSCVEILEVEGV